MRSGAEDPLKITVLATTFPKASETFLQREVRYLGQCFPGLQMVSIHRGEPIFDGRPVARFSKWTLGALLFWLPYWFCRRPRVCAGILADLGRYRCPSWLNFQETLLGLGYALCNARRQEKCAGHRYHATWATMPASAALLWKRLLGLSFSMEAHAYDIFQHGGDWLIRPKLNEALWIRTSTEAGRQRLLALGANDTKVIMVRRGLLELPTLRPASPIGKGPLKLVSAGRFVPKKGLGHTLRAAAALRDRGIAFELLMAGDGPLRAALQMETETLGLSDSVRFCGFLAEEELQERLRLAHFLVFTGECATDGNRDGLPNVIPEAMASGAVVLSTDVGATTEAVTHGETGFILPAREPDAWVDTMERLTREPSEYERVRRAARHWCETHYLVSENLRPLIRALRRGKPT